MFVNYVRDAARPSPVNLAIARILLGTWLAWRVVSLEWGAYRRWPFAIRNPGEFLHADLLLATLPYLQWVLVALLALFVVGYRIRLTGGLAGLVLIHMLSVKASLYLAGTVETLFVGAYFLLLFAFFSDDDRLSVDGLRRTSDRSLAELNAFLGEGEAEPHRHRALYWALPVVGLMYFGAGLGKLRVGGLDPLLSGADLQRVLIRAQNFHGTRRPAAQFIVENPELAWLGHAGSIVVELAFVGAILAGLTITPFVLALIGFHLMVLLTIGLYFVDMILFLGLFAAWDRGYARLARDESRSVDLVYDGASRPCARSLVPFKHLDVNDSIRFHVRADAPRAYRERPDVDLDAELYVFRDGEAHGGYRAFLELLRQFAIFAPVVWLLARSPVAAVGERIYGHVAGTRDRQVVPGDDG